MSRQSPLKAAFGLASVAWNGKSRVRLHTGRRKLKQSQCEGGKELVAMLQVQMAHCFMCGLNGLCQPSHWRHIIWGDHTKTLSTKIQRFINKGHFHDSKCQLDGRDSFSHHEDKSRLNTGALSEDRFLVLQYQKGFFFFLFYCELYSNYIVVASTSFTCDLRGPL